MKSILFFAATLIAFSSCETAITDLAESQLPKTNSKLVVHAYISPQNPNIEVSVTESVPLFPKSNATEAMIENALVRLSDGEHQVIIPFDAVKKLYSIDQSKFQVTASKTYSLYVSDGNREVTAQCVVPAGAPVIKSYKLDTMVTSNPFFSQDTAITLKLTWQDMNADTNYYRVVATADVEYDVPDPEKKTVRAHNDFDFIWDNMSGRKEWQSDIHLNGALFSSPLGKVVMPHFTSGQSANGTPKPFNSRSRLISVTMAVYNTDKNYFNYHRSLQERMDTENPFTEPSRIFGNIEGGLGCFGAYNIGKLVYKPD